jgi:hypothetical protein
MGTRNAFAAVGVAKVSDRADRVLVAMALHALDEPWNGHPARHYHGGRDLLCTTLGWHTDTAARRKIDRALVELQRAGLVERDGWHAPGRRQAWWLRFPGLPVGNPVDNGPNTTA